MEIVKAQSLMNVPLVYQGEDFLLKNFDDRAGVQSTVKMIGVSAQEKMNLVISSSITGIGKTRLAVGWLTHLWTFDIEEIRYRINDELIIKRQRYSPSEYRFINCRDYDYKFEFGGFNTPDLIEDLMLRKRGIVIDDLGREGDKSTRAYLTLISNCHTNMRPLCITTNLNPDAFWIKYGLDIKRRILENGQIIDLSAKRSEPKE